MANNDKVLQTLLSITNQLGQQGKDLQGINKRLDDQSKDLQGVNKRLDDQSKDLQGVNKRLDDQSKDLQTLMRGQAAHQIALKALGAGHQDLGEKVKTIQTNMATRGDVDIAVEAAKLEIRADINTLTARLVQKVHNHERRLDNAGIPNPDKH